jgi:hypothetical protein
MPFTSKVYSDGIDRVSGFVRSPEGKEVQGKIWTETTEVLKQNIPGGFGNRAISEELG